jgi:uncharacterized protein (DUF736 family)
LKPPRSSAGPLRSDVGSPITIELRSSGEQGNFDNVRLAATPEPAYFGVGLASIAVGAEHPDFPIEGALTREDGPGWRASQTGEQQIRIIFDTPLWVHRIQLRFHDAASERTQEFSLRWSPVGGTESTEIVRQQWTFSPEGSITEAEDYAVNLENLSALELAIVPDFSFRNLIPPRSRSDLSPSQQLAKEPLRFPVARK